MANIARNFDSVSVGTFSPTVVTTASPRSVYVNGVNVIIAGDNVSNHSGGFLGLTQHNGATITATLQSGVLVNGIPVVVGGDAATCDPTHVVVANSGNVSIDID